MELRDKHIVVTGASSGIGLELTRQLLENGCHVVAAARSIHRVTLTHKRLHLFPCDISTPAGVDSLFEFALKTLDRIDLFVANAGFAYYEKMSEPDWPHIGAIYDTNVHSVFYSAQKMKQLHGDQPFNFLATASGVSFVPIPGFALYGSTKAALHSFAQAYRWELGKGQTFQVVYPIATRTEFFSNAGDSPLPWPVQDVQPVVKRVISGIRKNKRSIYPSKLFRAMLILNGFFPFIIPLYARLEYRKYVKATASEA